MSNSLQPHGLQAARLLCPWNSPTKNTAVGSNSLLQGSSWLKDQIRSALQADFLLFEPPGKPLWRYRLLQNTEYSFPCYTPVLWWSVLFKDANPIMGVHLLDFVTSQTSHILIPSCLGGYSISTYVFQGDTQTFSPSQPPFIWHCFFLSFVTCLFMIFAIFLFLFHFLKLSYRSTFHTKDISLLSHVVEIFFLVCYINFKLIFVGLNF